jgi:hypothetical protein
MMSLNVYSIVFPGIIRAKKYQAINNTAAPKEEKTKA